MQLAHGRLFQLDRTIFFPPDFASMTNEEAAEVPAHTSLTPSEQAAILDAKQKNFDAIKPNHLMNLFLDRVFWHESVTIQ